MLSAESFEVWQPGQAASESKLLVPWAASGSVFVLDHAAVLTGMRRSELCVLK